MQVIKSSGFSQCIDGTILYEYTLDEAVTPEFVAYLGHFGSVDVIDELKLPLYSFTKTGFFSIKGLIGDETMYVRYPKAAMKYTVAFFHELIVRYNPESPDIGPLRKREKDILERITTCGESG